MPDPIVSLPPELKGLDELALDLRWSWSHDLDTLWMRVNPELWKATRNPWLVLRSVGRPALDILASDAAFTAGVRECVNERARADNAPHWYGRTHPAARLRTVAYFSMEYGISEALPFYAGGLGVLAGDYLKTASDLGVPAVGIGLLYQQGYFRQVIDADGNQREYYPVADVDDLPILPVRDGADTLIRIPVPFPGRTVFVRAWQARIGRIPLYLLDSNDPQNTPADRGIGSELYGGGTELRLQQELVLGIAGWKLLNVLGLEPDVCHLNEGHAAFVVLERAAALMDRERVPFEVALAASRPGTIFTTHTPVAAGFDRFEAQLVAQYLGRYADDRLGISIDALLALGQGRADAQFMPALLAMRASGAVNGVSRRHGEVSRELFAPLFPRWPLAEIPVGSITNGVHTPSWDSPESDRLWTQACGKERWREDLSDIEGRIAGIDGGDLWEMRARNRSRLVQHVRERLERQLRERGAPGVEIDGATRALDPNTLTIGFARRFAAYKRPLLLLHDEARLLRLLHDPARPVQLIVAGKAHPQDDEGKALIRAWVEFVRRADVRGRAVFLSDYDLLLAEELVQGVDVWLNTPHPPWEACGTSGMKVLVNGGLNFSEVDGWWPEAYEPRFGWALGRQGVDESDAAAAQALYQTLETQIVPAFYTRDGGDVPPAWVDRMRASMAELTPRFSTNRMLREYLDDYYFAAADAVQRRTAAGCAQARALVDWQHSLAEAWRGLRFDEPAVESSGNTHRYEIRVHLGGVDPASVRVELYAAAQGATPAERHPMQQVALADGIAVYRLSFTTRRAIGDYTARALPFNPQAIVPLEAAEITWQR